MAQVGHLNELQTKYFDKGLRVVAISAEPLGLLEKKMLEEKGVEYWIGSDTSRSSMKNFSDMVKIAIPHSYLVDATGKVVSEGMPDDQQIEALLDGVFDETLGRELHTKLAPAVKSYEKGDIGKAWKAASKLVENEDEAIAEDAKFLVEKTEAYGEFRKTLAEGAISSREYLTADEDLADMAKAFSGMPVAEWSAKTSKELDADPDVKNERKAWKALLKVKAAEEKANGKAKKMKLVRKSYLKLVDKYAGTNAAEKAAAAASGLGRYAD